MRPRESYLRHTPASHGGKNSMGLDHAALDFSSSVSPLGCPVRVRDMLESNTRIDEYPDAHSRRLMKALEGYTGLPGSRLVAGNGAVEIIHNFCSAYMREDTDVLIAVPTFQEYEAAASMHGARPRFFHTMNMADDIDKFIRSMPGDGIAFLCNPNNPTGTLLKKPDMRRIVDKARRLATVLFVDECFIEMVPDSDESVLRDVHEYENLVVLRSLTKSFGLAGVRVGYAAGPPDVADMLRRIRIPWSISSVAQDAAVAALNSRDHLAESNRMIREERRFLQDGINRMDGFHCHDSSTVFLLVRTPMSPVTLQKRLLENGILVRDCSGFRGMPGNFVRIAVRPRGENQRLLDALEDVT